MIFSDKKKKVSGWPWSFFWWLAASSNKTQRVGVHILRSGLIFFILFPASQGVHENSSVFSEGSKGKDGKRREVEKEWIRDSCTDQLFVFWELLCWMSECVSERVEGMEQQACPSSSETLGDAIPLISYFFFEVVTFSPSLPRFFFSLHLLMISAVKNKCFLPTADRRTSEMIPRRRSQLHPLFLATLFPKSITKNYFLHYLSC